MFSSTPLLLALSVFSAGYSQAGADAKAAQRQVEEYVAKLLNKEGFRRINIIEDETLKKVQPDSHFIAVLFPQYPIGIDPPSPMKVANVFVVNKGAKMHTLTDISSLEKYCKANFPQVQREADAVVIMRAWLKLSQHVHGDGYYQFEIVQPFSIDLSAQKRPTKVSGSNRVKPIGGNMGQITATIAFDGTGKIASVKDSAKLVEGIRPICQVTKLLDADPVIRKMAERDLLVMGRSCQEYILMQRAKSSPKFRREIDRVWKRILEEGR